MSSRLNHSTATMVVALLVAVAQTATAQTSQRTISVTGYASTSAVPDSAMITTGVVTEGDTAQAALTANNEAMNRVYEAMKEFEIADEDVQTSNFQIRPDRNPSVQRGAARELTYYTVSNQVRVHIRDLDRFGEVLVALVEAGANQASSINFEVDNRMQLVDDARLAAIEDARRRGERYAAAADVRLGKVLSIAENAAALPTVMYASAAVARGVPIAAGEQELSVTMSLVFAIADGE